MIKFNRRLIILYSKPEIAVRVYEKILKCYQIECVPFDSPTSILQAPRMGFRLRNTSRMHYSKRVYSLNYATSRAYEDPLNPDFNKYRKITAEEFLKD